MYSYKNCHFYEQLSFPQFWFCIYMNKGKCPVFLNWILRQRFIVFLWSSLDSSCPVYTLQLHLNPILYIADSIMTWSQYFTDKHLLIPRFINILCVKLITINTLTDVPHQMTLGWELVYVCESWNWKRGRVYDFD